jgi:manganese oxidase
MSTHETRRKFIFSLGVGAIAAPVLSTLPLRLRNGNRIEVNYADAEPYPSSPISSGMTSVTTPGISKLPFELDGNTKVFRLIAQPVQIFFPDMSDPNGTKRRPISAWGYNGSVVGPTIEAVEGDRVRILVTNNLPEPTSVHWHGLHVPIEMDGVTGISQDPIQPGETFTYEFTLEQHGTYFYHPHFMSSKQVGLGMCGFFIIHPKNPEPWQIVDHDYAYFLQTWKIHPGSPVPDTLEMNDSNYFTFNGKAGPDVVPMKAKSGEKVRIRVANLSLMSHPVHLHGHSFRITDYGAGFIPQHQHILTNTNSVSSGEARAFDFTAGRPGKWVMHCHFLHHVMNDMHRPPIIGGGGHAGHEMGGMHTWIEITN